MEGLWSSIRWRKREIMSRASTVLFRPIKYNDRMLRDKLQAEQIQALKSGDKERLEVLRFLIARIKNKEIDKQSELTDEEVVDVLRKQVKELDESIAAFEKGGRTDLIEQSRKQRDLITPYLPAEISDDELKNEVKRLMDTNKAAYEANPKSIIGICMKELKSKAAPQRIMAAISSISWSMEAIKKALFFLLVLFLLSSFTKTIADYFQNMNFYDGYKSEYEKEKKKNIALKTQIIKNTDPYQVEKIIRNDLNLARENEVAVVLPEPTVAPNLPSPTPAPVWQQWRKVFFSQNWLTEVCKL